jgi:hypothetical protein
MIDERLLRRTLIVFAFAAFSAGPAASWLNRVELANEIWVIGTVPVIMTLCVSMARDFLAGRMGVDAVAFVAMGAAVGHRRRC